MERGPGDWGPQGKPVLDVYVGQAESLHAGGEQGHMGMIEWCAPDVHRRDFLANLARVRKEEDGDLVDCRHAELEIRRVLDGVHRGSVPHRGIKLRLHPP